MKNVLKGLLMIVALVSIQSSSYASDVKAGAERRETTFADVVQNHKAYRAALAQAVSNPSKRIAAREALSDLLTAYVDTNEADGKRADDYFRKLGDSFDALNARFKKIREDLNDADRAALDARRAKYSRSSGAAEYAPSSILGRSAAGASDLGSAAAQSNFGSAAAPSVGGAQRPPYTRANSPTGSMGSAAESTGAESTGDEVLQGGMAGEDELRGESRLTNPTGGASGGASASAGASMPASIWEHLNQLNEILALPRPNNAQELQARLGMILGNLQFREGDLQDASLIGMNRPFKTGELYNELSQRSSEIRKLIADKNPATQASGIKRANELLDELSVKVKQALAQRRSNTAAAPQQETSGGGGASAGAAVPTTVRRDASVGVLTGPDLIIEKDTMNFLNPSAPKNPKNGEVIPFTFKASGRTYNYQFDASQDRWNLQPAGSGSGSGADVKHGTEESIRRGMQPATVRATMFEQNPTLTAEEMQKLPFKDNRPYPGNAQRANAIIYPVFSDGSEGIYRWDRNNGVWTSR